MMTSDTDARGTDRENVAESVGEVPICPGCGMAAHITHGDICVECFNRRERWSGGGPKRVVTEDGEYHETPLCPGMRDANVRWWYLRDEDTMHADLAGHLDKCVRCHSFRTFGFDHYDEEDQGVVVGHA